MVLENRCQLMMVEMREERSVLMMVEPWEVQ